MENEIFTNEVVNNEAAAEVVKEATKRVDLVELGVKGLAITGGFALIGGAIYGGKKLYNKFFKKNNAEVVNNEQPSNGDYVEVPVDNNTKTDNKNNG